MGNRIDLIETDEKIIPPLLRNIGDRIINLDEKHRTAVTKYLRINEIPFLIRKFDSQYFKALMETS